MIAVIALLGGFRDVPPSSLPRVAIGETYEGAELRVTVEGVTVSDLQPVSQRAADEGEQYLIVTALLENTTTSASYQGSDSVRVRLDGVVSADDEPDRFIELRNAGGVGMLQPGLPVRVAYIWTVSTDDVAVGDPVAIALIERFRVSGDPIFGDDAYGARTLVGRIDSTVARGEVSSNDD